MTQFDRWALYSVLFVMVCAMCFVSWYVYTSTKDRLSHSMLQRVSNLAITLDLQTINSLRGFSTDTTTPEYKLLKKKLQTLSKANPDVEFIYLMTKRDGKIFFVADSEEEGSPDESPAGQEYTEAAPSVYDAFSSQTPTLTGTETDRWGTSVTAFAPLYDEEGKLVWVVGMDMSAERYVNDPIIFALIPAGVFFMVCLLMLGAIMVHNKELKLMTVRNQFVSLASHELRSPITGIRWSSESLMQDERVAPADRTIAENINSACTKLLSIINELLDAASLESKTFDRKLLKPVALKGIVTESIEHLKLFAKEKKVTVQATIIEDPCVVLGDSAKLFNVVSNLLSNAIKYSNPNSRIIVTTMRDAHEVYLFVQDFGIGIPADDISKVSRGYYRAPNAIAHTTSGTGLGLYVSNQTIRLYKGELRIHSTVGKGTTITIMIPAAHT